MADRDQKWLKDKIGSLPAGQQSEDLEDSRLLFKAFCDGLMYGMLFYHGETLHRVVSIEGLDETVNGVYPIKECRPCLRPMSSMTEKERKEFVATQYEEVIEQYPCSAAPTEIKVLSYTTKTFDWLNRKHFDHRGLIPMGLAEEWKEKTGPGVTASTN